MDYKSNSNAMELVSHRPLSDVRECPTAKAGLSVSRETIAESCRPIFLSLKLGSFDVSLPPVPPKILLKIYCGILFIVSLVSAALVVYELYKFVRDLIFSSKQKGLLYVDHIATFLIFVNYLCRRDTILLVIERATVMLQALAQRDGESRKITRNLLRTIHRWATALSLGCFFHFLINCTLVATATAFHEQLPLYNRINFTDYYFGIQINGYLSMVSVSTTDNFAYPLLMLCTNLYIALMLVVFVLLCCCFQQLNGNMILKTQTNSRDMSYFQAKHNDIGCLVRTANDVFSPIVLILLITKIIQLVCSFNTMKKNLIYISFESLPFILDSLFKLVEIIIYGTAVGTILLLTTVGGKFSDEAEESINVMLTMDLERSGSIEDDPLEMNKSCHITALFAANCMATPVSMTASDLFNVNYKLLAVIVPAVVTGITLISEI